MPSCWWHLLYATCNSKVAARIQKSSAQCPAFSKQSSVQKQEAQCKPNSQLACTSWPLTKCQKSLTRKSKRDCTMKTVQHFIKENIELVCPYPFPRMAYNLHWRCLHAALDCASIHSGAPAVPISLPSLPSIPEKWPRDSAGSSTLLLPPNGDCLRLLRAVHIPSHDGHAQCVLSLCGPLWRSCADSMGKLCLLIHHSAANPTS